MDSEHKISCKKGNNYCIQIGSKEMFEDLNKLNVFPNKTKRLKLPSVPSKFWFSFLRGYFDGDGNVWVGYTHKESKKPNLTIRVVFTSCTKSFLEEIRSKLFNYFSSNGVISCGRGNYYRLTYSVKGSLKLYKFMYNSRYPSLYLSRKKVIFEKYLRIKGIKMRA